MATLVYDCVFSVALFILGIYIALTSSDFINKKSHYVEIVYWCLLVISVINLAYAVHKIIKQKYDRNIQFTWSKKLTIFSILTILFALSVNYLGFYLPAVIFVFAGSYLINSQRKFMALAVSILIVTCLNLIFSYFLNINFPQGIFSEIAFF